MGEFVSIGSALIGVLVTFILFRMYIRLVLKPRHQKAINKAVKKHVGQSRAIIWGQSCESLVPWMPEFPYSPPDVRHLGSPIDLVVFDGLTAGGLRKIILVEIKTGKSSLTSKEQMVQAAVKAGKVEFEVIRLK